MIALVIASMKMIMMIRILELLLVVVVYINTCVCMYVDYVWAYMPKHTCSCKSMGKFVI